MISSNPIQAGSMQRSASKKIPSTYYHANLYPDPNKLSNFERCSI
jgi:hypothetical protein